MNETLFFDTMGDGEALQQSVEVSATPQHYPKKPGKIYLYGTCLVDMFYPMAGMDAIELLEQQGVEVIFPANQSCCGQPAYTSGYEEEARAVAKSQIECFDQPWPVVILSGSCGGMMRHHYLKLFKDDPEWEERAAELANRVFEFTEFLVNVLDYHPKDRGKEQEVVLHTSCTARREMNVNQTGARIIDECSNVTRLIHDHESECCGFGGTFLRALSGNFRRHGQR